MASMQQVRRASIAFTLSWASSVAAHRERLFVRKVNFWRDIFPGNMFREISSLGPGESCAETFSPGVLVPPAHDDHLVRCRAPQFEKLPDGSVITPRLGRFYPQGLLWRALGCFRGNMKPFRIISLDRDVIVCDANHPLALFPLQLEARCVDWLETPEERGGTCNDIAELVVSDGPGMQIPFPESETDFFTDYPFRRNDERDDSLFYRVPRLVDHLDEMAISHVRELYGRVLENGSKVLDLMCSSSSHLPESLRFEVTGLGMNREELACNPVLSRSIVHDLNREPQLPFADGEFDAVVCTASIEYLTRPAEILREAARVSRPGAKVMVVFSDRWFPGKEILPWSELHPFERLGLVLDCFRKAGAYGALHTETVRGYARPEQDPYIRERAFSDPLFAVWGSVGPSC
ncbi:MAG: class I SAM-dependent methyltransferase [Chlorobi bacterium]|nr:class I SAM-dependent methyltransferase [Chlorobiota bacterium]